MCLGTREDILEVFFPCLVGICTHVIHVGVCSLWVCMEKPEVGVFVRVSVAVMETPWPQQLGEERVYFLYTFTSLFIIKSSQDRNSDRTETQQQELMQRPQRSIAHGLAQPAFFIEPRTTSAGLAPSTTGWVLPWKSLMTKVPCRCPYSQIWVSLLSDVSGLGQVDTNLVNTAGIGCLPQCCPANSIDSQGCRACQSAWLPVQCLGCRLGFWNSVSCLCSKHSLHRAISTAPAFLSQGTETVNVLQIVSPLCDSKRKHLILLALPGPYPPPPHSFSLHAW